MRRTGYWMVTLSLMLGCASKSVHTPTPVPITEASALHEFRTTSSVSLVNGASDPDHAKWTAAVVTFLTEQLEQRGAEVVEGSARQLKLEIVKVKRRSKATILLPLAMPEGCHVAMQAGSGDGYVQVYTVEAGAYFWQAACDKGVTTAVVDMLNDPTIRGYLEFAEEGNAAPGGN